MMEPAGMTITHELLKALDGTGPAGEILAGGLPAKKSDNQIEFGFQYRNIPFVVHATGRGQGADMEIRASLGHLPYTAEDSERRLTALAIVRAASEGLGGRVYLDGNQRIILADSIHLDEPLSPRVLLTRTVSLLLDAKPYLELIALVVPPPLDGKQTVSVLN